MFTYKYPDFRKTIYFEIEKFVRENCSKGIILGRESVDKFYNHIYLYIDN